MIMFQIDYSETTKKTFKNTKMLSEAAKTLQNLRNYSITVLYVHKYSASQC